MDLGKQVGPLPLGAWIVVVGGGLGLAAYGYNRSGTTGSQPSVVDPGTGDGSVGGWTPTTPASGGDTGSGGDSSTVATNEAWGVRAINWLIAQGYDAAESDSAIRKYIAGNDPAPSIKEYVLQSLALQHFGSPPSPLPPPLTPPPTIPPPVVQPPSQAPPHVIPAPAPPPPRPAPSPVRMRTYTVKPWPLKGSSLWSIATIFYGNGALWPRIYNANRKGVRRPDGSLGMISNPNLIHDGWVLYIP